MLLLSLLLLLLLATPRPQEEQERLLHYLDSSSKWQLIHCVEKQLIAQVSLARCS